MNKTTAINNNDNGLVDRTQEAILAGVSPDRPQDICTKYPETCTADKVLPSDCAIQCCVPSPAGTEPIIQG